MFGNDVSTERSYSPDKQALKSIVTEHNGTLLQNLAYDYNALGNLKSRTDALQPQIKTERFRYDPLERLTCAYFSPTESASVPCAYSYDYASNGNLIAKSDIGGTLSYTDALHPHAVTGAGGDGFGYDAVGNQVSRPGATLTYTPFDLPKTITQAAGTITFAYDGDEQRIRKTTPEQETLYFGDLYERVTEMGQSWNPFSYVGNNPLSFVDPSGFEPDKPPIMPIRTEVSGWEVTLVYPPRDGDVGPPPPEKKDEGEKVGAYVPPVDVSPTGNTATYDPQPVTTVPEDWREYPAAQFRAGMLGGAALGVVPFAGVGEQLLDAADVLPQTQHFRTGVAIGQIFGGLAGILGGVTGEIAGGLLSTTGVGAAIGVPAIAVSTTLIVGGIGNIAAGVHGLMSTGAGTRNAPAITPPPRGTRLTGDALKAARAEFNQIKPKFWKNEAAMNSGKYSSENLARMSKGNHLAAQTAIRWSCIIAFPSPKAAPTHSRTCAH